MMTIDERHKLLQAMTKLQAGEAENVQLPFQRVFLPLDAHKIALRSEIVVVRGGRGSGKSALFKILQTLKSGGELRSFFDDSNIPDAEWIDAFSQSIDHPTVDVLDQFCKTSNAHMDVLRAFWMGHLLCRLDKSVPDLLTLPEALRSAMNNHHHNIQLWVPLVQEQIGTLAHALDEAERHLQKMGKRVFATYDHLDRIGLFNTDVRRRYVGGLLALWLSFANRYSYLRPKIFLREDLFDAGEVSFPDASKLRARSVSIDWDVESLFRVVIRYMSEASNDLRIWLERVKHGVSLHNRNSYGWMPGPLTEEARNSFATLLAGKMMGKGGNKGYTYRWIPNHLQDSQKRIVPRSILNIFGFAAESALKNPLSKGNQLIRPDDLYNALEQASKARVNEICEEYPLVKRLENLRGLNVMLDPKEAIKQLGAPISGEPSSLTDDGKAVLDELVQLGVVSIRADGRIDVPDIYRSGFGIKRKGGVKRAR